MKIDHPRADESLPQGAIMLPKPEPDWIWVVRGDSDVIVAYMVVMHGHGIAMPIRLYKLGKTPTMWMQILLRTAAREVRARGYGIYLTWVGDNAEERKLQDFCVRRGAKNVPMRGDILVGRVTNFMRGDT